MPLDIIARTATLVKAALFWGDRMPSELPRTDDTSRRKMVTLIATLVALAIVVGLTLSACTSQDAAVVEEETGEEATIAVGGTLEVALDSNLSVDHVWLVSEIDPAILVQAGEPSFESESDEPGAPGIETFYFDGVGTGTTLLKLEYLSPAELEDPARTFEITVIVE